MPALPSVPNALKAGFAFGLPAGEFIAKVALHFLYTGGPPDVAAAVAIANTFMDAFDTDGKGLMANELQLNDVTITDLSSPTGAVGISTHGVIAGTRGSSDIPSPLCATTTYKVSRRYRGGHPKSYWPFGVNGDLATFNTWGSTFISDVDTDIPAMITACLAASSGGTSLSDWVQISYFHGATPFTEPSGRVRMINTLRATPVVDPLTYGGLMNQFGVQKRRRGAV